MHKSILSGRQSRGQYIPGIPYRCTNTTSTLEGHASWSEYRYHTAVSTPQVHKEYTSARRAMAECQVHKSIYTAGMPSGRQSWSVSRYRYRTAVPTPQVHKSMPSGRQSRRNNRATNDGRASPTLGPQNLTRTEKEHAPRRALEHGRVSGNILLLYQRHTNEYIYHTAVVPKNQVPYCLLLDVAPTPHERA